MPLFRFLFVYQSVGFQLPVALVTNHSHDRVTDNMLARTHLHTFELQAAWKKARDLKAQKEVAKKERKAARQAEKRALAEVARKKEASERWAAANAAAQQARAAAAAEEAWREEVALQRRRVLREKADQLQVTGTSTLLKTDRQLFVLFFMHGCRPFFIIESRLSCFFLSYVNELCAFAGCDACMFCRVNVHSSSCLVSFPATTG